MALCLMLVSPLLKVGDEMLVKQVQLEQSQLATAEVEQALELIGRAIRMTGYVNGNSTQESLEIQKKCWLKTLRYSFHKI